MSRQGALFVPSPIPLRPPHSSSLTTPSQSPTQAHTAYASGDGSSAHQCSEEAKRHGAAMDAYNRQASEYIFRENNGPGRVDADAVDLHGQYVEEAEEILERRIATARAQGQRHLHV